MNFDVKAARWFRRIQESYKALGVLVADPFEGMDIARELMFRRKTCQICRIPREG
jgi:hypothetical protein